MRLFLSSLCVALTATFLQPLAPMRAQAGILLKTFNLKAGRLLLDPTRPRLYATLPLSNSVAVIDTNTNTLLTTFFVGVDPVDMAISPDGARLYVANSGSDSAAIGVVELDTLTVRLSLPAPSLPTAIATGPDNRLYVLCSSGGFTPIVQIDGSTGTVQTTFGSSSSFLLTSSGFLQTTPDHKTLFYGGAAGSGSALASFDVSTATPGFVQQAPFNDAGGGGQSLTVNHQGDYLAISNNEGNLSQPPGASLIPTNNLGNVAGTFSDGIGGYIGPTAFSGDDALFYEVLAFRGSEGQNAFWIFDTATFKLLASFDDPSVNTYTSTTKTVTGIAVTAPDGYLYVAATDDASHAPLNLQLISTQTAPFFSGSVALSGGYRYLKFSDGTPFAYYNFNYSPYLYHDDLGFEFPFDAADGQDGIYLYDFASQTFWYTSSSLYPYLYDFSIASWLYYYPDLTRADHYNTGGVRYFYDFADHGIINK